MSPSTPPIPNPVVVLREEFDDWAVLFNPDTAAAVGINPVGVAVWKLLDGKRSLDDIVSEIGRQYDDVPGAAREDLEKFIDDLVQGGYVGYEVDLKPT